MKTTASPFPSPRAGPARKFQHQHISAPAALNPVVPQANDLDLGLLRRHRVEAENAEPQPWKEVRPKLAAVSN